VDNVQDKGQGHQDRHQDEGDPHGDGLQFRGVSQDARHSRLCPQEEEDHRLLRRRLLARIRVLGEKEAGKEVLARQDRDEHETRQEDHAEVQEGWMVRPALLGARHRKETRQVQEKDTWEDPREKFLEIRTDFLIPLPS